MRSRLVFVPIALLAVMVLVGCPTTDQSVQKSQPGRESTKPSGQEQGHASAKAKPGSHEDWCGEHQVPESLCTRCNPALIAAFKATGDWCEEHKLPESQCLLCNPDLKIERPPKVANEG